MKSVLRLEEIREAKGLSVSQLSYKSGIARGYITELEEGKYQNPGLEVICKLCKAFNVSPNDLIQKELWISK